MRISELASLAETPLSAVKYYQREGLLPEGEKSAPNQTSYGAEHVQRVKLVRALLVTGGLSIAATKEVIAALDSSSLPEAFGVAQHAMSAPRANEPTASEESRKRITQLAQTQGWAHTDVNPGIEAAARALDGLAAIGFDAPDSYLSSYARAAHEAAQADLRALADLPSVEQATELMVVGTVLGDPLFAGLRRLAQQDATYNQFSPELKGTRP